MDVLQREIKRKTNASSGGTVKLLRQNSHRRGGTFVLWVGLLLSCFLRNTGINRLFPLCTTALTNLQKREGRTAPALLIKLSAEKPSYRIHQHPAQILLHHKCLGQIGGQIHIRSQRDGFVLFAEQCPDGCFTGLMLALHIFAHRNGWITDARGDNRLLLREGRKIFIDCTGVEDALDVTMAQQTETPPSLSGAACMAGTPHQVQKEGWCFSD